MRIALYHNLPSGGAKRALYEWIRRLADRHTIEVFTLSTADHGFCDLRPYTRRYQIYNFQSRRTFSSPLGRLNQFQRWRDLQDFTRLHRRIAADIDREGYDLAFVNPSLFSHVPPLLTELHIPSVYYLHEPVGKAARQAIHRPAANGSPRTERRRLLDRIDPALALYQRDLRQLQEANLKAARLLLANSKFTRQRMAAAYALEAEVCYLGVDTDAFRPLTEVEKAPSVISVGEVTPRKGYDFLIRSLALIEPTLRPVLKIASNWEDAAEKRYLQDVAGDMQVEVRFLGNLNSEQLCQEYNQACLCVYTPIEEPFGLVALEAMACGTPVVGVAEGGVLESVLDQSTGLLVARDTQLFAQAVANLLANPTLTDRYGTQCRRYVLAQWNWEASLIRLENYLIDTAIRRVGIDN